MTTEIVHRIIIDAQHPMFARASLHPLRTHFLAEADPYECSRHMAARVRELAEDTHEVEPDAEVVVVGNLGTAAALAIPGDLLLSHRGEVR